MRNSSMKSIVAALSISVTLLAAAPIATARPAKDTRTQTTVREEGDADRFAAMRQFVQRVLRRVGIQNGITIPVPAPSNPNED